jgi:hypothetical protein
MENELSPRRARRQRHTTPRISGCFILDGSGPAGTPIVSSSFAIKQSGELKYLAGLDSRDRVVIVFDDRAELHKHLAEQHALRPLGGGWVHVDLPNRRLYLSGRSQAFGVEPDRQLSASILERGLPDFVCLVV